MHLAQTTSRFSASIAWLMANVCESSAILSGHARDSTIAQAKGVMRMSGQIVQFGL